jgi:hypothetical protein
MLERSWLLGMRQEGVIARETDLTQEMAARNRWGSLGIYKSKHTIKSDTLSSYMAGLMD